jgi:mRNA interferase YafQ
LLEIKRSSRFRKEYALAERRGRDMDKLKAVMGLLINEQPLPPERKDHPLHGEYTGSRECHIQGDWVLVYEIDTVKNFIAFQRTGTHSDLF